MADCELSVVQEVTTLEVSEQTTLCEVMVEQFPVEIVLETVEIIENCKQGPAGPPGGSASFTEASVAPAATVIMDTLPIAQYRSAKWLVSIEDDANSAYVTFEVLGIHDGTNAESNTYGIVHIGPRTVEWIVDLAVSVGNLQLSVTNDGSINFDIRVTRVALEVV